MARLYVGTYAKYNEGSIDGAWLDLEDYNTPEDFLEACYELHSDEEDPELMFQDYEDFPSEYYSESSPNLEAIYEWLEMDDEDRAILEAYQNCMDSKGTLAEAKDALYMECSSWDDFVRDFANETLLSEIKHNVTRQIIEDYFDYEAYVL